MSVEFVTVEAAESDLRLDRWLSRHYPGLTHGRIEKLLRTGQLRIDGGRAKANQRLNAGQVVRVPPLGDLAALQSAPKPAPRMKESDALDLRSRVLYMDDDIIAINKPAGLAVQGGTGTTHHLDAMLDALKYDYEERPRLVHRLDKDTSGVLVLGRTAQAASRLANAFKHRSARKTYWALVVGCPLPHEGEVDAPLSKRPGRLGEKMDIDEEEGQEAVTLYRVLDHAHNKASWLELKPLTGRTHQLRVHCLALGCPILGDGKYGGPEAFLHGSGISRKLHLHARSLELPAHGGKSLIIEAPIPEHFAQSMAFFEFEASVAKPRRKG
ncbi:MAG: RluA family pseudouridine synthase [Alphaproteobacteria bacterium]|nr:RluA family pseudouridine synthase [Alphaproteobacteria bacterium]